MKLLIPVALVLVIVMALLLAVIAAQGDLPVCQASPDPPVHPRLLLDTVPDVRQSTSYSCGASSLQAVLCYWGIDAREGVLIDLLGTSQENGTPPDNIVSVARKFGLDARVRENLTLEDLGLSLQDGVPVIVIAQAWSDNPGTVDWNNEWTEGHYMVVIGLDGEDVCLEDPAILGSRGYIPREEFLERWHDIEGDLKTGRVFAHTGIIIEGSRPAKNAPFIPVR